MLVAFFALFMQTAKAQVLSIQPAVQIRFNGEPNVAYQIQTSTTVDGGWTDLALLPGSPTGEFIYYHVQDSISRFYRAVAILNPGARVALSPSSPLMRTVKVSSDVATTEVVLAKFDITSNTAGTLKSLAFDISTKGVMIPDLFSKVTLVANGRKFEFPISKGEFRDSTIIAFSQLDQPVTAGSALAITLTGEVPPDVNHKIQNAIASVSIDATRFTSVRIEDQKGLEVPVVANKVTANDVLFTSSEVFLSGMFTTYGGPVMSNNEVVAVPVSFHFSATAIDKTIYISKRPSTVVSMSIDTDFRTSDLESDQAQVAGDNAEFFVIPAGSSRNFTLSGSWVTYSTVVDTRGLILNSIPFGTSSSDLTGFYISTSDALKAIYVF